jgi:AraC-like DNA-binding protein
LTFRANIRRSVVLEPRTVANAYVRTLLTTAESRGVPAARLLRGLPVTPAAIAVPHGRTGVTVFNRMWIRALELTGDPGLGLRMARSVKPATFRVLGLAVMSSETLGQAMHLLLRYQRLVSEAGTLSLHPDDGGGISLEYTQQKMGFQLLPQQVEAILGGVFAQASWLAGRSLRARHVSFRHAPQVAPEEYRELFGVVPRFGADVNRIGLTDAFTRTRLPHADAELCRMHCALADEELARLPQVGFIAGFAVQWLMARANGSARLGDLAEAVGMSPRSLQRQLRAEGTSWTAVVDVARRDTLAALLKQGATLEEAAQRLGYHDASSVSRAARRWFGKTPGRWLKEQR